jgi:hypothetical protein
MEPAPIQQIDRRRRQYLAGIGVGAIPLVIVLLCGFVIRTASGSAVYAVAVPFYGAILLYGILIVFAIICLFFQKLRYFGYGVLTMGVVDPIIAQIGCQVILTVGR